MVRKIRSAGFLMWLATICIVNGGEDGIGDGAAPSDLERARARAEKLMTEAERAEVAYREQAEAARIKAQKAREEAERARARVTMLELRSRRGAGHDVERVHAIRTLLRDPDEKVRALAMQMVGVKYSGRSGPRRGALPETLKDPLVKAISQDPSDQVRRNAIYGLASARPLEVLDVLVAALDDPSPMVKEAARRHLVQIHGKDLPADAEAWRKEIRDQTAKRNALLVRLERDKIDMPLLDEVKQSFTGVRDTRAIEPLLQLVRREDVQQYVARRAMEVVGGLADESTMPELIAVLKDSTLDPGVRGEATSALGQIGTEPCVRELMRALSDGKSPDQVRINAVRTMRFLPGDLVVVPPLIEALNDENPQVQRYAMSGLRVVHGGEVGRLLLKALDHESAAIRGGAAQVIAQRRLDGGLDPIIELLKDEDDTVQEAATVALGTWGADKAVPPLLSLYQDAGPKLRAKIISSLGWCKSQDVVALVMRAVSDESAEVRLAAAYSVGQRSLPESLDLLTGLLTDEHGAVKRAAISGLASLKDPRGTELLLEIARDSKQPNELRSWTLTSLSMHRRSIDTEVLLELIRDPSDIVRRATVEVLVRTKPKSAITPLIRLLGDERAEARSSACLALRGITGQRFGETETGKWEAWWRERQAGE